MIRHQSASCRGNIAISRVIFGQMIFAAAILLVTVPRVSNAENIKSVDQKGIFLQRLEGLADGYGYRLQYYVAAPLETFWRFKTDFESDVLLTNKELIGHRLVRTTGNIVITENRYASAPGLRFLWQTTVINSKYRLEFKLLNPDDCRHKFHHGFITLEAAGEFTLVTQTAYFDFTGASLWVKYPWYGGMKYTLTSVAKWEQKMASQRARQDHLTNRKGVENVCKSSVPIECDIQR